jgi:tRNA pseudouridine65 synthase
MESDSRKSSDKWDSNAMVAASEAPLFVSSQPLDAADVAPAITPMVIHNISVLFQNDDFIAIHKPPGLHVHQPEMARRRVPREMTLLWTLRRQIEKYLYPVHRLDVATEGVLIMAFDGKIAGKLQAEFQGGSVQKVYHAIVRGWTPDKGRIDLPLERDSNGTLAEATTSYRTLARVELAHAVGKRYPTARYSLVEARPETGRWHQIRRHLARIHHPIVGDREHGDSHHSRFFRETLGLPGLWLRAADLAFTYGAENYEFHAPLTERWVFAGEKLGFAMKQVLEAK